MYVSIYMYIYTHTCIYTYIHTYTYKSLSYELYIIYYFVRLFNFIFIKI